MRHHERLLAPATVTRLLPVAGAAAHARNVVTEACLAWHCPELLGPAALIVSELVANVIKHAHTMIELEVGLDRHHLQIRTGDGSTAPPVLRPAPATSTRGGRGLRLVTAVSHAWGHVTHDGGKVVWACLITNPR